MIMLEKLLMVIALTIHVKSKKNHNDLLETNNGITQKYNNGKSFVINVLFTKKH